jgi:putative transposase
VPRSPRSDLPDGVYQVTSRGVDGCPIFRDDEDRRSFLRVFADTVTRFRWRCHAFCLMGTHYHLVVETTRSRLSAGVHRLNGLHAQRFNRRHGRRGHLFGDRFAAWLVETDEHLRAACRYTVENPVRAGLASAPRSGRGAAGNVRSLR